MAKLAGLRFGL